MSLMSDEQRKEFFENRENKKEDKTEGRPNAELKTTDEPIDQKSIYDIKTIDELLEYYYIIPKVIEIDNYKDLDIKELLEQITLKVRGKTNLNIVKRGRMKKKLNKKQIEEIKASNKTNAELGKIYGVSPSTISAVKNNKY